ncbi:IGR protein motif-domain-containing protein [Geopyxis carbonaria]|nr:IGR protein motif-domain-containing protein [Geopyxis carbonaria]
MQSLRPCIMRLPVHVTRPTAARFLHHTITPPPPPAATTEVGDVGTFLTKIGRGTAEHAPKFTSWENFFEATSQQLKELGIEPPRTRRYIIRWRETFRRAQGNVKLFEQKRGVKVDGGERRVKMVRAKRYQEERKAAAEKAR